MTVSLAERSAAHVSIYWRKTQDAEIKALLPSSAQSEEQALEMFQKSLLPAATSYGKVILADGQYVGDIWCYCIDEQEEKSAMLSYCIFEKSLWNKGIVTQAAELFLREIFERYSIEKIGAFTYSANTASIRVLEKLGFDRGNGSMRELAKPLEEKYGPEFAARFYAVTNLNDRAMFSSRSMEETHRESLLFFRNTTIENINKQEKWYRRFWLKWFRCLY